MASRAIKWNKEHDKILLKLFETPVSRGGISSDNLSKEAIKEVIRVHFPDRNFKSFASLFRNKARKFNINRQLNGARNTTSSNNYTGKSNN